MANVNVIYHHFPHYRAPVMRELTRNGRHSYRFWGSHDDVEGVKAFKGDGEVVINPLHFYLRGRVWVLKGYAKAVLDSSADVIIVHGSPAMPAAVIISLIGRVTGKRIMFWTHGWLRRRPPRIARMRNLFFRLADKVMVYAERAVDIAVAEGFPEGRVCPIYNSLDYDRAQDSLRKVEAETSISDRPQAMFNDPGRPLIICTARLTSICRFDILLYAANILKSEGRPVNILLVGDGPERDALEKLSESMGLSVNFYGSCYDEDELARLIYWSDITVSPGKIGLTAMHSLTYGTPAITHGDLDAQMPEVEAIIPGVSGLLFKRNDPVDLAKSISTWLENYSSNPSGRLGVRFDCQEIIKNKWNPVNQRNCIELAIDEVLNQ